MICYTVIIGWEKVIETLERKEGNENEAKYD
jgi:hypothetical protein